MAGRKRVRELCSSGRRTLCATLCGADHHHCAAWKHARVLIVARLQLRQVRRQGGGPLGSPEQARERESAGVRSPNSTRVRGKARQPVHVCPPTSAPHVWSPREMMLAYRGSWNPPIAITMCSARIHWVGCVAPFAAAEAPAGSASSSCATQPRQLRVIRITPRPHRTGRACLSANYHVAS